MKNLSIGQNVSISPELYHILKQNVKNNIGEITEIFEVRKGEEFKGTKCLHQDTVIYAIKLNNGKTDYINEEWVKLLQ